MAKAKAWEDMSLREKCDAAAAMEAANPSPKKKKSAADIEALRWREMFQAALTGMLSHHGIETSATDSHYKIILNEAALFADAGLVEFYRRYEREK
jgi:hypothetical protein